MVRARSVPRARRCVDANRRGPPRVRERDRSGSERAPCSARDGAASPRKRERDVASRSFVRAFVRGPRDRRERSVEPVSTFRPSAVERTARRRIDRSIHPIKRLEPQNRPSCSTGAPRRPASGARASPAARSNHAESTLSQPDAALRARRAGPRGRVRVPPALSRRAHDAPRPRRPPLTEPFSPVFYPNDRFRRTGVLAHRKEGVVTARVVRPAVTVAAASTETAEAEVDLKDAAGKDISGSGIGRRFTRVLRVARPRTPPPPL